MEKVKLSKIADVGFRNAGDYDAHRPSYPPEAVNNLLAHMHLVSVPSPKIVELGAGTGKFTSLLAEIIGGEGEIFAVEPHKEMREELEAKNLKGVVVKEGSSEDIPVEVAWSDGVIIAQAFHWFANEESLRECHRVLKPGGSLGLIWNIENYNSPLPWPVKTKWEESLKSLTWSFSDAQPRFRHLRWKEIFESPSSPTGPLSNPLQTLKATFTTNEESKGTPLFSLPLGEEKVEWTTWLSEEDLWKRYCTLSQIAITKGAEREKIRKRFDEVMGEVDGENGERNEKGEVGVNGVTVLYWTSRV